MVHDRLSQTVGVLPPLPDTNTNTRLQRPAANQNEYLKLQHVGTLTLSLLGLNHGFAKLWMRVTEGNPSAMKALHPHP